MVFSSGSGFGLNQAATTKPAGVASAATSIATAGSASAVPASPQLLASAGNPAAGAAAVAPADNSMQIVGEIMKMMLQVAQMLAKNAGTAPAPAAAAAKPAGTAGTAGSAAAPAAAGAKPTSAKVTVIDDFKSNDNGFQHGTEVAGTISSKAGGNVSVEKKDVAGQGTAGIKTALKDILAQTKSGNKPTDVINISQFFGQETADTAEIRQLINELDAAGIKTVVAAGNNGPGQENKLAVGSKATIAANGTAQSGKGTVTGEGRTTSFAAADVSAKLAKQILGA